MLTLRPISEEPPIPACPLCKPQARHPVCDLFSHYEWMAKHGDPKGLEHLKRSVVIEAFHKWRTA